MQDMPHVQTPAALVVSGWPACMQGNPFADEEAPDELSLDEGLEEAQMRPAMKQAKDKMKAVLTTIQVGAAQQSCIPTSAGA